MTDDMKKPKIIWEINLGEILSVITMLGVAGSVMLGAYHNLDNRINNVTTDTRVNQRNIEVLSTRITEQEVRTQRQYERLEAYLIRIDKKLDSKADK